MGSRLRACYAEADRLLRASRRYVLARLLPHEPRAPPVRQGASLSPAPDVEAAVRARGCGLLPLLSTSHMLGPEDLAGLHQALAIPTAGGGGAPWRNLGDQDLLSLRPALYRLGLGAPLLDFAEGYLGRPCLYLGATLKREDADGSRAGSRGWHLDIEDRHVLRILFYLNDVEAGGGPFEYVAADRTRDLQRQSGYRSGYLSDAQVARIGIEAPASAVAMLATAGDAVVFDGARVLHRAQPPEAAARYSLTLTYTSRRPRELRLSVRLTRAARRELALSLSPRQCACLPAARML